MPSIETITHAVSGVQPARAGDIDILPCPYCEARFAVVRNGRPDEARRSLHEHAMERHAIGASTGRAPRKRRVSITVERRASLLEGHLRAVVSLVHSGGHLRGSSWQRCAEEPCASTAGLLRILDAQADSKDE